MSNPMSYAINVFHSPETACRLEVRDGMSSDKLMNLGGAGCMLANSPADISYDLSSGDGYGDVRDAIDTFRSTHEVVGAAAEDKYGRSYFLAPSASIDKESIVASDEYGRLAKVRDFMLGKTPLPAGVDKEMVLTAFANGVDPEDLLSMSNNQQSTIAV